MGQGPSDVRFRFRSSEVSLPYSKAEFAEPCARASVMRSFRHMTTLSNDAAS